MIYALQLSPAASSVTALIAAGLMVVAGLGRRRLEWRRRPPRVPRRLRRGGTWRSRTGG